jgi:Zn-dependent protease with chaperone function
LRDPPDSQYRLGGKPAQGFPPEPPEDKGPPKWEGLLKWGAGEFSADGAERALAEAFRRLGRIAGARFKSAGALGRESGVFFDALLIALFLVYFLALYKIFQFVVFFATVGSVKEILFWLNLSFFRYEPLPAAITAAMGFLAIWGSARGVRDLGKGPAPLIDDMGGRLLGRSWELAGPAGRRRQEVWLGLLDEISKAARVPAPKFYALPAERGVNLIAIGVSPEESALAVTYGAFALLSDKEAEAFLAFGVARIADGSAAFGTRCSARLHGLMLLSFWGRRLSSRQDGWLWAPWILEMAARALGLVGSVLARWFQALLCSGEAEEGDQAAISLLGELAIKRVLSLPAAKRPEPRLLKGAREQAREAGAKALASAFKKTLAWHRGSRIATKNGHEVSPLFIASPDFFAFSLRHPSIIARIRELDPEFSG